MNNKEYITVYNRPGDIVFGQKRVRAQPEEIQLIEFIDYARVLTGYNAGTIMKKVGPNDEYYTTELWNAMSLKTDVIHQYRIYRVLGEKYDGEIQHIQESSLEDRKVGDFPDNEDEVNLLQDSYEEFINDKRDFKKSNFHLRIKIQEHINRLNILRMLIKDELDDRQKQGYLLHLMQKETPTLIGKRKYEEWCKSYPRLFTKLKQNVYNTNYSFSAQY